jgi:hypothetical protein
MARQPLNPSCDRWVLTLFFFCRIARNLPRLEALDLSNVPSEDDDSANDPTWLAYLSTLEDLSSQPKIMEKYYLRYFSCFTDPSSHKVHPPVIEQDTANSSIKLREDAQHRMNVERPDGIIENSEPFLWRLMQAESDYRARSGEALPEELRKLEAAISESHLCGRLKWIGVRDWRLKPESKHVCRLAERHCNSLVTFSIRGDYDRDHHSDEVSSVHHHVCSFIGGVANTIPTTVKTIELRLTVPFIEQFLRTLKLTNPHVRRVGIDLGAWVQVYPLRVGTPTLADNAIRDKAVAVARQKRCDTYEVAHGKIFEKKSMWHLPAHDSSAGQDEYAKEQIYKIKQRNFYRNVSGTVVRSTPVKQRMPKDPIDRQSGLKCDAHDTIYDFFDESPQKLSCPLHCPSMSLAMDTSVVDTLYKMLKKLCVASIVCEEIKRKNRKTGVQTVTPGGAKLFALEPEREERSLDPIHPLVLIQKNSKPEMKCGDTLAILIEDVAEGDTQLFPRLEETFKWRPVFDWDW